jgi:hypothetical protein
VAHGFLLAEDRAVATRESVDVPEGTVFETVKAGAGKCPAPEQGRQIM